MAVAADIPAGVAMCCMTLSLMSVAPPAPVDAATAAAAVALNAADAIGVASAAFEIACAATLPRSAPSCRGIVIAAAATIAEASAPCPLLM